MLLLLPHYHLSPRWTSPRTSMSAFHRRDKFLSKDAETLCASSSGDTVIRLRNADAETDSEAVFNLVNESYDVECGENSKHSFKKPNQNRLSSPLGELQPLYDMNQVLKAEIGNGESAWTVVGVCVWKIIDIEVENERGTCQTKSLYFGPFAVSPAYQGRGIGKALMREIELICNSNEIEYIDIVTVNHRRDLIDMYTNLEYSIVGEAPYPFPFPGERLAKPSHFVKMRKKL